MGGVIEMGGVKDMGSGATHWKRLQRFEWRRPLSVGYSFKSIIKYSGVQVVLEVS